MSFKIYEYSDPYSYIAFRSSFKAWKTLSSESISTDTDTPYIRYRPKVLPPWIFERVEGGRTFGGIRY